jgi:hypothetical protein
MMTKTQDRAGIMPASPVLQQIQIVSKHTRTDAQQSALLRLHGTLAVPVLPSRLPYA